MANESTAEQRSTSEETKPQGWYRPLFSNTQKLHYHGGNGKSLCNKYRTIGSGAANFSNVAPPEKDRCKNCYNRLQTKNE